MLSPTLAGIALHATARQRATNARERASGDAEDRSAALDRIEEVLGRHASV